MKKWSWVFVLTAVAAAVAVPVVSANDRAEVTYAAAAMGDIEVGLELVGYTAPSEVKNVLLTSDGIVSEVCVEQGDKVISGEKLVSLTSSADNTAAVMASASVSAENTFSESIKELAKNAGCDLNLFNSCVLESHESAEVFSSQPEIIKSITSPISGKVMSVGVAEGVCAAAGMTAAVIADTSECIIEASVYEDDVDKVYIGMPARITADGNNAVIKGSVSFISDSVTRSEGLKNSVLVKITPDEKIDDIIGRSVKAVLEINKAEDVLTVPCDAVKDGFVFVIRDGVLEKRAVEVGLTNGIYAQITNGLGYLEEVALICDEEMADGMAVEKIDRA